MARPSIVAGLMALGTVLGANAAADACEVRLSRVWTSIRGGHGTIYVARNGAPCGDTIYAVPREGIPVDRLRLASAPAHGKVTIEGAKFAYRPDPGFTGEDRFALVGMGQNHNGRLLRLRGLITAIVR